MKRVLLFLAEGFEVCEALAPVDILSRAGAEVTLASVSNGLDVRSSHGVSIHADVMAKDIVLDAYDEFDMVVLPGGMPGTTNLQNSPLVNDVCSMFDVQGKWIAAICAAPSVFGSLGLLDGRRATVYPGMEDTLYGATPTGEEVTVDEHIITGQGMGAAIPFALTLVEKLCGEETARQLAKSICYRYF